MDYDDQHYSEVNPDTLDLQDPAEVMLTVWAALRPCREVTAQGGNRKSNSWIKWAEPKRWHPDCGFEVFTTGKHFGKTKFATVAFNIVGNDYEIYVQRRFHDVVLVFSTRDDGPVLSPKARLKAAVSKMLELTNQFNSWSRDQSLNASFPADWVGTHWTEIAKSYFTQRFLVVAPNDDTWRCLIHTYFREFFDEQRRYWANMVKNDQLAIIPTVLVSIGVSFLGILALMPLWHAIVASFWWPGPFLEAWTNSANAWSGRELHEELNLFWGAEFLSGPLYVLLLPALIYVLIHVSVALVKHLASLWTFLNAKFRGAGWLVAAIVITSAVITAQRLPNQFPTQFISMAHHVVVEINTNVRTERLLIREFVYSVPDNSKQTDAFTWIRRSSSELRSREYYTDPQDRIYLLSTIYQAAKRIGVDPDLILALIDLTSGFDRSKESESGHIGLMQIHPSWQSTSIWSAEELHDNEKNVHVGTMFLNFLLQRSNGDLDAALNKYGARIGQPDFAAAVITRQRQNWSGYRYFDFD